MNSESILINLINALGANRDQVIHVTEQEIATWPESLTRALKSNQLLINQTVRQHIVCPGCEEQCTRPLLKQHQNDAMRYFTICETRDDTQRVEIETKEATTWQFTGLALAKYINQSLNAKGETRYHDEKQRWSIGLYKGNHHSGHLYLLLGEAITVELSGHTIPFAEIVGFKREMLTIDKKRLNRAVDHPKGCGGSEESAQERRHRLQSRKRELKDKEVRNFLQVMAGEEGVSVQRIKQLLKPQG